MLAASKNLGGSPDSHEFLPAHLQVKTVRVQNGFNPYVGAGVFRLAYEWNIITNTIDWYGRIFEELGYAQADFPATLQEWHNIIHPDACNLVRKRLHYHLKAQEPYLVEYRVRRKNGNYMYVLDTGTALRNDFDTPYKFTGVMHLSHQTFSL